MGLLTFAKAVIDIFNPRTMTYQSKNLFPDEFDYYWDIKTKKWDDFNEKYAALPYDAQSLLQSVLSERLEKIDHPYDAWPDETDQKYIKMQLTAAQMVARAWYYRGGGTADTVDDDHAELFLRSLLEAKEKLLECLQHQDCNGLAYEKHMAVQLGLSNDLENIKKSLDQMRQLDQVLGNPRNLQGHINYFNATCEKWLGSHEEMFTFAREYAMKDTDFGYMACLICHAHMQMWLYLIAFEEDEEAADAYFKQASVREELMTAHQWFNDHYNDATPHYNVMAHNMFAGLFYWAEQHDAAKQHFLAMEKRATPFPWMYIGTTELNKARKLYQK